MCLKGTISFLSPFLENVILSTDFLRRFSYALGKECSPHSQIALFVKVIFNKTFFEYCCVLSSVLGYGEPGGTLALGLCLLIGASVRQIKEHTSTWGKGALWKHRLCVAFISLHFKRTVPSPHYIDFLLHQMESQTLIKCQ